MLSGVDMTPRERELFRPLAQRDPPRRRVKELWVVVGMRGGKDSIASLIGGYAAAFTDYRARLRPGEAASVICLACDRQQAKIVLKYTKAYFQNIKMLRHLVRRENSDGLELTTGAELTIATNTFRGIRGRSIACVIMDEVAFWRDEASSNPDIEVYNAIKPGTETIEGSMIVGISSPYRRTGLLYDKWRKYFGKDDDDVLVIHAPTRALNPTVEQKTIDQALEDDPAAARANWLAEWRDDLSSFIERDLIQRCVDVGVTVRAPRPGVRYTGFADAATGVGQDSFSVGIVHKDGGQFVLDLAHEVKPPFSPDAAMSEISALLKSYNISSVTGDKFALNFVAEGFARNGISYKNADNDRSQIYANVLPLITSGRVRLIDNRKLVTQFASLERQTSAGGKDAINHGRNAHDDLCNLWRGRLFWRRPGSRRTGWTPLRLRP
jgi:hypothetical protein